MKLLCVIFLCLGILSVTGWILALHMATEAQNAVMSSDSSEEVQLLLIRFDRMRGVARGCQFVALGAAVMFLGTGVVVVLRSVASDDFKRL